MPPKRKASASSSSGAAAQETQQPPAATPTGDGQQNQQQQTSTSAASSAPAAGSGHNIPDPSSLSIDTVLDTSAANVEGYLRNVSRRARHTAAGEGGRGTKVNRVGAVTSSEHTTLAAFKAAAAAAGPDGKFALKRETAAQKPAAAATTTAAVKPEGAAASSSGAQQGGVVDLDDDVVDATPAATSSAAVDVDDNDDDEWAVVEMSEEGAGITALKAEQAAAAGGGIKPDMEASEFAGVEVTRSRDPLAGLVVDGAAVGAVVGQPATDAQGQPQPSLWELREQAKAQRWVEKNHLFAQCVTAFVLFVHQARALYRSSRHPKLGQALREVQALRSAMDQAKAALDDGIVAEVRKRNDLTPAWVSLGKDATGTTAGHAAKLLVDGIAQFLTLELPSAAAGEDQSKESGGGEAAATAAAADDGDDASSRPAADEGDPDGTQIPREPPRDPGEGRRLPHDTGSEPVIDLLCDRAAKAAAAAKPKATAAPAKGKKKHGSGNNSNAAASGGEPPEPQPVPHPAHFSVAFIAVAAAVGLRCRLCSAFGTYDVVPRETRLNGADEAFRTHKVYSAAAATAGGSSKGGKKKAAAAAAAQPKKKPQSPFWVEVWCPVKRIFFSVNPCPAVTTRWGSAYTVACGGDHVADVTPRYVSAWSAIYRLRIDEMHYTKGFLWPQEIPRSDPLTGAGGGDRDQSDGDDDDAENAEETLPSFACKSSGQTSKERLAVSKLEPTQRILWPLRQDVGSPTVEMLEREAVQLGALKYSEPVPTTLSEVKSHPLFVTEDTVTRYEGIYPKTGKSIVGYVRGKAVYRRDCVHQLRSKQGWLRIGLMVSPPDEPPYKLAPPPPSRPLVAHSQFFGKWQTVPFEPAPINDDGTIPRFESTSWYLLLCGKSQPGTGLSWLTQPNVATAARRMQTEFAVVVTGWKKEHAGQERVAGAKSTATAFASNRRGRGGAASSTAELSVEGAPGIDSKGAITAPTTAYSRVHYTRSRWVPQFKGIVVPSDTVDAVTRAYTEWAELKQRAEATKRRQRAMRWWRILIQHALARLRIQSDYAAATDSSSSRRGRKALPRASLNDM